MGEAGATILPLPFRLAIRCAPSLARCISDHLLLTIWTNWVHGGGTPGETPGESKGADSDCALEGSCVPPTLYSKNFKTYSVMQPKLFLELPPKIIYDYY